MKITLWDIKGFGKFDQFKAAPKEGFNIIYEANESGKSTLQAFIRAMLFGQRGGRKTKDGNLPPIKHYKPWVAAQYAGVLEYTLENGSAYRIGRNFDKGTTNVYDGNANNLTLEFSQDKELGPKFAEEHLGLDEVTFDRSAFIRQMQSAVDEDGRKALLEKLSNINATGNEELSLTRAVDALESALLERVGTGRSTTRPLDKVNMRISELEQRKQAIIALNEQYLDTASSLHEKKSLLKEMNEKLKAGRQQKDTHKRERLHALKQELARLKEESDYIDNSLKACNSALFGLKDFEEVTEDNVSKVVLLLHEEKQANQAIEHETSRLRDLKNRLEVLKESTDEDDLFQRKVRLVEDGIKNYSELKEQAHAKNSRSLGRNQNIPSKPNWTRPVFFAIGLLVLIFFGSYLANHSPIFLALGLSVIAISGVILLLSSLKKTRGRSQIYSDAQGMNRALIDAGFTGMSDYIQYRENQLKLRGQIENNTQRISEIQRHLEALHSQVEDYDRQLMRLGGDSKWYREGKDKALAAEALKQGVESLKKAKEDKRILLTRGKGLEEKLGHLLREAGTLAQKPITSQNDLEEALLEVSDSKTINRNTLDDSDSIQLDREIRALEGSINEVQLEITTLNTRLEQAPGEGELAGVLEELENLQKKKEALERVGSSLTLASQVLRDVASRIQHDYIPALNKEMGRMMDRMTTGRYRQTLANDMLQISLEAPETDELIPVNRLSGGAIDQVYFCMRLAAVRLLEKGREPLPLFLDEPFAQYDEDRAKNAFELLKEMAGERQIFFFTCRHRELELAQAVFGNNMNRIRLQQ